MRARGFGCGISVWAIAAGCSSGGGDETSFATGVTIGETSTTTVATTEVTGDGSSADATHGGSESSTGEPVPPFACDIQPTDSPTLDGLVLFEPAQPHPGDTLTVIVAAQNGLGRPDAPPMMLEVTSADGVQSYPEQTIQGGAALYYYAIPDVPLGDLCLLGLIDGGPEVSAEITVTPRPAGPPASEGVFKVVENHQWTCDEQPDFGNEIHVRVEDENGAGIGGVTVDMQWADTTDPATIYNDPGGANVVTELVTDDQGEAVDFNFWPISDNGLLVFELSVTGSASDIATEITTGWWEDDLMGCSYCGIPNINVWGHWSYSVTFRRDPDAMQACVVPTDHAGMLACGEPTHIHHHPDVMSCWSVQ